MREILLTRGQVALVDDEDFEWLIQWKWHAAWAPGTRTFYAQRSGPRAPGARGHSTSVSMHRAVLERKLNRTLESGEFCDHENHDTLDNRRANLRAATHNQNARNARPRIDGRSRFKGVTWHRKCRAWKAQIRDTERRSNLSLGNYPSEEQAARAYDYAALWVFGGFAYLNFPEVYR